MSSSGVVAAMRPTSFTNSGLADDELIGRRHADRREVAQPVETRAVSAASSASVSRWFNASGLRRATASSDAFDSDVSIASTAPALASARAGRVAGERHHLHDVRAVLAPQPDGALVGLHVVLAIGQRQTVGTDPRHLRSWSRAGSLRPTRLKKANADGDVGTGQRRRTGRDAVEIPDKLRQFISAVQAIDACQQRLERLKTPRLDRRGVHARGVVVARLANVARGPYRARRLEDAPKDGEVLILHLLHPAVAQAIGRQRRLLDPAAAGELVEVGARLGVTVERLCFDAHSASVLRLAEHRGQRQRNEQERDEMTTHQSPILPRGRLPRGDRWRGLHGRNGGSVRPRRTCVVAP